MTVEVIGESHALTLDERDPLPSLRAHFEIPAPSAGPYPETAYLAGARLGPKPFGLKPFGLRPFGVQPLGLKPLGLQPFGVQPLGVQPFGLQPIGGTASACRTRPGRSLAAEVLGALPAETLLVAGGEDSLSALLDGFYQPSEAEPLILVDASVSEAVRAGARQLVRERGLDPDRIIELRSRDDGAALIEALAAPGNPIALALVSGLDARTGGLHDLEAIAGAARAGGVRLGCELSDVVGNVALQLHEWGVDWAIWSGEKYLNAPDGSAAGVFVHERHGETLPTDFAQWWQAVDAGQPLTAEADPAEASGPGSLHQLAQIGMPALRAKSIRLTGYLESLLDLLRYDRPIQLITPRNPYGRGAQLSVRVHGTAAAEVVSRMRSEHGVVAAAFEPDLVVLVPAPLYCTYHDCWRAAQALAAVLGRPAV